MQLTDCGPGATTWYDRAVVWRNRTLRLLDHIPVPIAVCEFGGRILIVNRAMAAEFGLLTGQLHHRKILEFFTLHDRATLQGLAEAVRLHRRSQFAARVSWTTGDGAERHGEMTVALTSDTPEETPTLLLSLRTLDEPAAAPAAPPAVPRAEVSPTEARILAAAARGATTAQIAKEIGLTPDGVNYHLTRLTRRWHVPNRTALVARAYATGVLAADTWPPEPACME
ncbi:LuxR C-terminal-related transcriptional regulator [Kitasatospora aureofaciens]|uniref:LuxR C-terminal-related transcriptional regulator n=1 Tax=Kitasatospora aureofaciens TaxID=1894 RepID=UPI001C48147C|nr:LuxR C-terminal-related transcriptional regulator [Kitasatospora aureofaciens]MBV6696795.1 LuxR C-terminal-related transcriptional regulator [Kitasatospora aureofaciens]